jgi:hypothetical protein
MRGVNRPKPIPTLSARDLARFWSLVDVQGPNDCWPWKGGRFPVSVSKGKRTARGGYPQFHLGTSAFRATRVALFLVTGSDLGDQLSCHSCDNILCCNGVHLFAGTNAQNMADCVAKHRQARGDRQAYRRYPDARPRGDKNHFASLDEATVRSILTLGADVISAGFAARGKMLPRGFVPRPKAAHPEITVGTWQIARILRGKAWSHLQ